MIPHVNESKSEFEDVDLQYKQDKTTQIKWYHQVLLNRTLKVAIALLLVAILVPLLVYQFVFYAGLDLVSPDGFSLGSCLIPRGSRLPCGVGNVSVEECHQQCCYDHSNHMCFHRLPSRFSYILDRHWAEDVNLKPRVATVPFKFQNSLTNIRLSFDEVSPTHLTISYYNSAEYTLTGRRVDEKKYVYHVDSPELNVIVDSTQGILFNTVRGPLVASENIWEVAVKLTNETMYGFGEIPIKTDSVKMIYNHRGGLNSIPLIYAKINDSYHGLLIDTLDPTEAIIREDNTIIIRSITNFGLKFHVFVGPKPSDVMRDVMSYVGFDKGIEYWMLGAHVCSEFSDENSPSISDFLQNATTQNMPFESHCVKPIVLDSLCESEPVAHFNQEALLLRNAGKRLVPHVSPYIFYEELNTTSNDNNETTSRNVTSECSYNIEDYADRMLQNPNQTEMYKGLVGLSEVVYPDFGNVSTDFFEKLWIYTNEFDGIVLENNWPLDESDKMINKTNQVLPYFSVNFEQAFNHTPQWNATNAKGEKYLYKHNEYGNSFAKAFQQIKSVPTGSSSQWMNGNVYVNRQDIGTSWTNLHKELIEAALGGISGHWQWSTPICGDTDIFDPEAHVNLCVKWYLAATYMPMIKVHSKQIGRDPLSFNGTHRNLMINAIKNRLSLAPYFYATLQEGPLLRPMFYQFPQSEVLKDLTSQFSVGNDLLIVPNLQPSQSMVHVIMPPGVWYELWSGLRIKGEVGQAVTMATTEADFLTLIRGGSIFAMQKDVKLTAESTRAQSDFTLTIALECETIDDEIDRNNTKCEASGALYVTSNSTVNFQADSQKLNITFQGNLDPFCSSSSTWSRTIKDINVFGLNNTLNNYDHMRHVVASLDLCVLNTENEMVFDFSS